MTWARLLSVIMIINKLSYVGILYIMNITIFRTNSISVYLIIFKLYLGIILETVVNYSIEHVNLTLKYNSFGTKH